MNVDVVRLLWAILNARLSLSSRQQLAVGMTEDQYLVLTMLKARGPSIAGDISSFLFIHPSTLTGVLKRLVRNGLVTRALDEKDKRRIRVALTQDGEAALARCEELSLRFGTTVIEEVVQSAAPDDVAGAHRLLSTILERLKTTGGGRPRASAPAAPAPARPAAWGTQRNAALTT